MTKLKQLNYEEQLKQLEEEYHYSISKISHEIRNPVTLINSFLQLIETQHPEVSNFDYWADTKENMKFLISLLEELSQYNNSTKLHLEEVNPYKLLSMLVEQVSPSLKEKDISLSVRKETAIPLLYLDTIKLKQAFLNLIRNAAEAIVEHGKIVISISSDGDSVLFHFANNGPCIPVDSISTIFEPFVTNKREGTGLGLAITKNIILAHSGTITVASSPTSDTIFTISLPV